MLTCNDLKRTLLRMECERRIPLREIEPLQREVARIAQLARMRTDEYQQRRSNGMVAARGKMTEARRG